MDIENKMNKKLLKNIWNSATPFGVGYLCMSYRRLKPTAIHVKPYRAT